MVDSFRLRYLPHPPPVPIRLTALELQNVQLQARIDQLEPALAQILQVQMDPLRSDVIARALEILAEVDHRLSLQDTALSSALGTSMSLLRAEVHARARDSSSALRILQDQVAHGFDRAAFSLSTHNTVIQSLLRRVLALEARFPSPDPPSVPYSSPPSSDPSSPLDPSPSASSP